MARQCPRGHDGIELEEDADDTSMQPQANQAQAPPWMRPSNRGQARGRHGRSPERRRQRGCRRQGSNRADLTDRRNRHRLIYRLGGISVAETEGAHQNQARRRRGDAVTR
jgi:hypothetical protein